MKILLKNRELSAFLAILALFAVLVALNPSYLSLQTLGMIFASSQILILLAIGAALVMLTRNIDVSVGSTVGLSAIAVGVALNSGYGLPVSILFALSIGALAGAFNGFLVVGLRIPAIVATLGTLGLYRGAMLLWTGGKWIEGLPPGLKSLSEPAAVGISPLGMLVLIIAATGAWMLSRTAFGRDFYAVGDNLAAARQLGVAVNRTRMIAFTLNGMLAACAGIVFAAQIGFVPNQTGSGLEMKAIAACVLGASRCWAAPARWSAPSSARSSSPKSIPCWCCSGSRRGGTTLSPGWCCWACWYSTGGCVRRSHGISGR